MHRRRPQSGLRALLLAALLVLGGCASSAPRSNDSDTIIAPERMIVVTLRNPVSTGLRGAGSTWRGWDWSGDYRVAPGAAALVDALQRDYPLSQMDAWTIHVLGVHCLMFSVTDDTPLPEMLARLHANRRVESAQPLQTFSTTSAGTFPDDPYRSMQHGLNAMNIDAAHRLATGKGVIVTIIDTGADIHHDDLADRIKRHQDLSGRRGEAFDRDRHGTAIAGVIGANAGNDTGIEGVAPEAELITLKACWPLHADSDAAECNSFTLARALGLAIDLDSDIVNLSLSGPADPLLARLVAVAVERGILVIGAMSADDANSPDTLRFPASLAGVIAVRSSTPELALDGMIAAPGDNILTTVPGNDYQFQSGSSLATASISGVAALLLQQRPDLSPAQLESLLRGAMRATPVGDAVTVSVDACAALNALMSTAACSSLATSQAE